MAATAPRHGLLAAFSTPEALLAAARQAHARGYRRLDALTPFPVDGVAELVGYRGTLLPVFAFLGGLLGGGGILALQFYSVMVDYPINVGGRPLASWPAFLVPAFECTVLGATLVAFFGLLVANRMPRLYHPVFNATSYSLARGDRFYLLVGADDPIFDADDLRALLEPLEPVSIEDVAP
jgi:hypothetical protein